MNTCETCERKYPVANFPYREIKQFKDRCRECMVKTLENMIKDLKTIYGPEINRDGNE